VRGPEQGGPVLRALAGAREQRRVLGRLHLRVRIVRTSEEVELYAALRVHEDEAAQRDRRLRAREAVVVNAAEDIDAEVERDRRGGAIAEAHANAAHSRALRSARAERRAFNTKAQAPLRLPPRPRRNERRRRRRDGAHRAILRLRLRVAVAVAV